MTSGDTRRTFLGSLILAGGSAAAFGKSFQSEEAAAAAVRGDALFEHIQLQMASMLRSSRARGGFLSAEDAATAAAFMRVCGIHARGVQLDDEARRVLAARLGELGRDGLINLPPDLTGLRSRMRRKGLAISDRLAQEASTTDAAVRTLALQVIQSGRTTQVCDGLADAFEKAAPKLAADRRGVRRAALPDEAWCNFLVSQWTMFLSIAWYVASFNDSTLQAFLDAMWSGFVFYEMLYQQQC